MVSTSGCVISGDYAPGWAAAMKEAAASYEVVDGASKRLRVPALEPPSEALLDPSGGVVDVDAVRAYLGALTRGAVVHEHVYALEADPAGASVWSPTGKARFDVGCCGRGGRDLSARRTGWHLHAHHTRAPCAVQLPSRSFRGVAVLDRHTHRGLGHLPAPEWPRRVVGGGTPRSSGDGEAAPRSP